MNGLNAATNPCAEHELPVGFKGCSHQDAPAREEGANRRHHQLRVPLGYKNQRVIANSPGSASPRREKR